MGFDSEMPSTLNQNSTTESAALPLRYELFDVIKIIGTWEFTWIDLLLNTPSLSLMIFFNAASDILQFILASSILCRSPFSWNMFCITNQDTATTFYIASYAYAITHVRNAAARPEYMCT